MTKHKPESTEIPNRDCDPPVRKSAIKEILERVAAKMGPALLPGSDDFKKVKRKSRTLH